MTEVGVIFLLLAAVAALATIANRIRVPYPILLVVSGLALAFVPPDVLPQYRLDPEVVFVLFLPPLLFPSAYFTSWRDFRRNLRAISLLAVGLVLFTVVGSPPRLPTPRTSCLEPQALLEAQPFPKPL